MQNFEIKQKIIKDLEFGIDPRASRCGVKESKFNEVLSELKEEQIINYDVIDIKLPKGYKHPYNGFPKKIYLLKDSDYKKYIEPKTDEIKKGL